MKRGRSTGKPTKAQALRFDAIRVIGCIACRARGYDSVCEVHHLTVGGRHGQLRRGHDATIGLCAWHHRGVAPNPSLAAELYGPSYARQPRLFRETFGDDDTLLQRQDALIAEINNTRVIGYRRVG